MIDIIAMVIFGSFLVFGALLPFLKDGTGLEEDAPEKGDCNEKL